jgi:hypothetical protein
MTPNVRLNAFRLGARLLLAAANPWSGMSREAAQKESWQPIDPLWMATLVAGRCDGFGIIGSGTIDATSSTSGPEITFTRTLLTLCAIRW